MLGNTDAQRTSKLPGFVESIAVPLFSITVNPMVYSVVWKFLNIIVHLIIFFFSQLILSIWF